MVSSTLIRAVLRFDNKGFNSLSILVISLIFLIASLMPNFNPSESSFNRFTRKEDFSSKVFA